jgi:hypothetical protein
MLFFFCALGLDFCVVIGKSHFGLDGMYHLHYFYVICWMCDDNNSCRHQHARYPFHWTLGSNSTHQHLDLPYQLYGLYQSHIHVG